MATEIKQPAPVPDKVLPRPWQFSLRELMLWMLALSVYFGATAALGPFMGILGALLLVVYAIRDVGRRVFAFTLGEFMLGLAALTILLAMILPALPNFSQCGSPHLSACHNNLRQISLALRVYSVTHGTYPPAYIADADGKPMHSWRVLILREMGRADLYAQYRFDEPWDGPNNSLLHSEIVRLYGCPSDPAGRTGQTSYLAVTGPGTMFPGDKGMAASQVADGTDSTLLVVEVQNSGIHWMEPRDLPPGQPPSSQHTGGRGHGAYVDTHVEFIPSDASPAQIRARTTIAGGEKIEEF